MEEEIKPKRGLYTLSAVGILIFIVSTVYIYFSWYVPRKIITDCSDGLLAWSVRADDMSIYNEYYKQCINSGGYEKFLKIIKDNLESSESKETIHTVPQPVLIEVVSSTEQKE